MSLLGGRFEVEKSNGTNSFGMWQCEMMDVLVQQGLDFVLEDKPSKMEEMEWVKLNKLARGSIQLCFAKDVKYFVMWEVVTKTLRKKLSFGNRVSIRVYQPCRPYDRALCPTFLRLSRQAPQRWEQR